MPSHLSGQYHRVTSKRDDNTRITCTGGHITLRVHKQLLRKFQEGFQGVSLQQGLPYRPTDCLVAVVGTTNVVFVNSVIEGARADVVPGLQRILCVADSSKLQLQHSRISNNPGIGLAIMDSAGVVSNGSRLDGNVADTGGAGVRLSGNATLALLGGSWVANNVARHHKGGGIMPYDSAHVTVTGRSVIASNTCVNSMGGGVALLDLVVMTIDGTSAVGHDAAPTSSGGGVAVLDSAQLFVQGGSSVSDNVAAVHGGGLHATDTAVIDVRGCSRVTSSAHQELPAVHLRALLHW